MNGESRSKDVFPPLQSLVFYPLNVHRGRSFPSSFGHVSNVNGRIDLFSP